MKKIIILGLVFSFLFTGTAYAASVSISPISPQRNLTLSGNSNYSTTTPEQLKVKLDGSQIYSSASGGSSWSVSRTINCGQHTVLAEIINASSTHPSYGNTVASAVRTFTLGCGNGDPNAVVQVWGLNGFDTPKVKSGTVIYDEMGVKDTCPKWYPRGCFNISNTNYYKNRMKTLARMLIANGFAKYFPIYNGWIELVR